MELNANKIKKAQSIVALLSLAMVFVAVVVVNQKTLNQQNLSQSSYGPSTFAEGASRNVASASPIKEDGGGDKAWQRDLASKVSQVNIHQNGKVGHVISPLERFLFEELRGQYVMGLSADRIKGMKLRDEGGEAPLNHFGKEIEWFEKHRELWWISFSKAALKSRKNQETVLSLFDQGENLIGEAHFEWDPAGRMVSLVLEKL